MKIKLELDGLTQAQAQAALAAVAITDDMAELPVVEEEEVETPEPEVEEVETPEPPAVEPEVEEVTAESLTNTLEGQFKRAKTATLADKERGIEGDEVLLTDGRKGIIHACFRGRCVVEFEDGSAEEVASPMLRLVPEEDTPPVEPEQEELEVPEEGDITLESLKADMDALMVVKGRGLAIGLLKQFSIRKLSDLSSDKYAEMQATMAEAMG